MPIYEEVAKRALSRGTLIIAALYAEATGQSGLELWALLMRDAQRLNLPSVDAGIGLVQAPV